MTKARNRPENGPENGLSFHVPDTVYCSWLVYPRYPYLAANLKQLSQTYNPVDNHYTLESFVCYRQKFVRTLGLIVLMQTICQRWEESIVWLWGASHQWLGISSLLYSRIITALWLVSSDSQLIVTTSGCEAQSHYVHQWLHTAVHYWWSFLLDGGVVIVNPTLLRDILDGNPVCFLVHFQSVLCFRHVLSSPWRSRWVPRWTCTQCVEDGSPLGNVYLPCNEWIQWHCVAWYYGVDLWWWSLDL